MYLGHIGLHLSCRKAWLTMQYAVTLIKSQQSTTTTTTTAAKCRPCGTLKKPTGFSSLLHYFGKTFYLSPDAYLSEEQRLQSWRKVMRKNCCQYWGELGISVHNRLNFCMANKRKAWQSDSTFGWWWLLKETTFFFSLVLLLTVVFKSAAIPALML
jgi:hypothetical protein